MNMHSVHETDLIMKWAKNNNDMDHTFTKHELSILQNVLDMFCQGRTEDIHNMFVLYSMLGNCILFKIHNVSNANIDIIAQYVQGFTYGVNVYLCDATLISKYDQFLNTYYCADLNILFYDNGNYTRPTRKFSELDADLQNWVELMS